MAKIIDCLAKIINCKIPEIITKPQPTLRCCSGQGWLTQQIMKVIDSVFYMPPLMPKPVQLASMGGSRLAMFGFAALVLGLR